MIVPTEPHILTLTMPIGPNGKVYVVQAWVKFEVEVNQCANPFCGMKRQGFTIIATNTYIVRDANSDAPISADERQAAMEEIRHLIGEEPYRFTAPIVPLGVTKLRAA